LLLTLQKDKAKKKYTRGFFVMLFCTLIIVSAIANSFGIRNSYAQLQTQQPSTITQQPLCQAGICNDNATQHNNIHSQDAAFSSSQKFVNSKNLGLNHLFVSNKVIGPDRFRFVTSYWTTSTTSQVIDAGTSANETRFTGGAIVSDSWPDLNANPKLEVDTGEGFSTLAVVLQYEGVVDLAGITAALKLPSGFEAQFPLTSDKYNYDIALSSYRGHIYPSQGITLYFSLNVLPTAKVQLSVLGPLALHFLRTDRRSILDSLDASTQSLFAKALYVTNTTFPNSTMFNDNFDFNRDYINQFGRFIPFDFINQVVPILFKVTGREVLDVHIAYTVGTISNSSKGIVPGNGTIVPVNLNFANLGDAPVDNMVARLSTDVETLVGEAVSARTFPLGILTPTKFYVGTVAPYSSKTETLFMRSEQNCDTLKPLTVLSTFNNVNGLTQTQTDTIVLQITGHCKSQVLGVEPGSGTPQEITPSVGNLTR